MGTEHLSRFEIVSLKNWSKKWSTDCQGGQLLYMGIKIMPLSQGNETHDVKAWREVHWTQYTLKEKHNARSNPAYVDTCTMEQSLDDLTQEAKVDKICLNSGCFGQYQNSVTIFLMIGQDKA